MGKYETRFAPSESRERTGLRSSTGMTRVQIEQVVLLEEYHQVQGVLRAPRRHPILAVFPACVVVSRLSRAAHSIRALGDTS
jgi:hypothetical protein